MSVCVFDNPNTFCREAYQDGKFIGHISAEIIMTKGFEGHRDMSLIFNVGRSFVPGAVYGDAAAMIGGAK